MKLKNIRKSTWILLVFAVYTAVVYGYFIPRSDASDTRIWTTVGVNTLIIIALWALYRYKEKMAARREKDIEKMQEK